MRRASCHRRLIAGLAHTAVGAALVGVALAVGILDATPLRPPPHWFWTEWLLARWLDAPGTIIAPIVSLGVLTSLSLAVAGGTGVDPIASALRLRRVDAYDDRPETWRYALRFLGDVLAFATFGLGFAWCFVSRNGRTWGDLFSGMVTVENDAT